MSTVLKSSFLFLIPTALGYTILAFGAESMLTEEGQFIPEDTSIVYYLITFIGALGSFILILWKWNKWLMKEILENKDDIIEDLKEEREQYKRAIEILKDDKPKKKKG